jgi:hypothetical protein
MLMRTLRRWFLVINLTKWFWVSVLNSLANFLCIHEWTNWEIYQSC